MACTDCIEYHFTTAEGIGTLTVIADDPNGAPLIVESVVVLSFQGEDDDAPAPLPDPTPAWMTFEATGVLVSVGTQYLLTTVITFDFFAANEAGQGPGQYVIQFCIAREDGQFTNICCQIPICTDGVVPTAAGRISLVALDTTNGGIFEGFDASDSEPPTGAPSFIASISGERSEGVRTMCGWLAGGLILYCYYDNTNNTRVFTIERDGSNDTERVNITNGGGGPTNDGAFDQTNELAFFGKYGPSGQLVKVDPNDSWSQTVILATNFVGRGALCLDEVGQRVIYWYNAVTFARIHAVGYDGLGDATLITGTEINNKLGLTATAREIQALAYHPTTGLLYGLNSDGKFFSADPATDTITVIRDGALGTWARDTSGAVPVTIAIGNTPLHAWIDADQNIFYWGNSRNTSNGFVFAVPLDDVDANYVAGVSFTLVGHVLYGFELFEPLGS